MSGAEIVPRRAHQAPASLVRGARAFVGWRLRDRVLLAGLVAAITGLNLLWTSLDTHAPHWDKARHLSWSLTYLDLIKGGHFWHAVVDYNTYPPLVYWVVGAFYLTFGNTSIWVAVLSNTVFLSILVCSTYGIGSRLWSRQTGLLAALFVVTAPMLVSQFKDFMIDAPLTALVALALYLLIRTDRFADRRMAILLGIAFGLGLLTKWSFPFYIGLPALVAIVAAVRASRERITNVALAVGVAFVIAAPWYLHNFSQVVRAERGANSGSGTLDRDPVVLSVRSFFWNLWSLVDVQLYLVPFLFFVVGVVFVHRRRTLRRANLYPGLLILGTYLFATLLLNKDNRYSMPMMSGVAVVSVHWLEFLRGRIRQWVTAGLVAYCLFAFAFVSFGTGLLHGQATACLASNECDVAVILPSGLGHAVGADIPWNDRVTIFGKDGFVTGAPSHEDWHQEQVIKEAAATPHRTFAYVYDGSDPIWFNTFGLGYYAQRYHVSWTAADQADLVIVRGNLAPPAGFSLVHSYALPDSESLRVYERQGLAGAVPAGPVAAGADELAAFAAQLGQPVYWVGPADGRTFEFRHTVDGRTYIRYLLAGEQLGDPKPALTVATYSFPNAFGATQTVANQAGSVRVPIEGGGVAFYSSARPTSVYAAWPGLAYQIEVFDPDASQARSLVAANKLSPVR